jgi:hypothetical protein
MSILRSYPEIPQYTAIKIHVLIDMEKIAAQIPALNRVTLLLDVLVAILHIIKFARSTIYTNVLSVQLGEIFSYFLLNQK